MTVAECFALEETLLQSSQRLVDQLGGVELERSLEQSAAVAWPRYEAETKYVG